MPRHAPESAPVVLTGEILDFLDDNRGGRLVRFSPMGERTLDEAMRRARRAIVAGTYGDFVSAWNDSEASNDW